MTGVAIGFLVVVWTTVGVCAIASLRRLTSAEKK